MLPNEMWEEVLSHLKLFDLLRLKRVSKDWNRIIEGVIKRACKWYEQCVAEIPKNMWSSMLNHQTHPKIRCENFDEAKIYSEIWITMYKSWIGWNSLTWKRTSIKDIQVFRDIDFLTFCAVTANIIAVGSGMGQIFFYDISAVTFRPIYRINHEDHIGDVVLCRSGSDVMAVAYSRRDRLYWDLKTKKQIHQAEYRLSNRILKANFDYCYSLGRDGETWILNVEQFVSGTVRTVRSTTFVDPSYVVKAMEADANQAILFMNSDGNGNKFWLNSPDNEFDMLSFHEATPRSMIDAENWEYKICKPRVGTFVCRPGKFFALSVNARPWKTYDVGRDIPIDGSVTVIIYHISLLIIAIKYESLRDAEVRLYPIENINNLDNLDFKSMRFKTVKFTSHSINYLAVTEYNSYQYLVAVTYRKVHVVKFELFRPRIIRSCPRHYNLLYSRYRHNELL